MSTKNNTKRHSARKVDAHIGSQLRKRRVELGLTQENLARELDLSYQQLQKYETNANRISGGRLWQLSKLLGVDPGYFYEGLDEEAELLHLEHGGRNRKSLSVVRNFEQIGSISVSIAVASLVKAIAGNADEDDDLHAAD
jgi:transcriptional regulator with XRE-family HTH domain